MGAQLDRPDARPTTVFCLHFLGGSSRAWGAVTALLPASVRLVAIDLPGFGDSAAISGHNVEAMADFVIERIRLEAAPCWMLAGHSMGAKVAAVVARRAEDVVARRAEDVVARRAEDGLAGLDGLHHLLLLAGSPPSPEPMQDDRRSAMAEWFRGDATEQRAQADGFITQNAAGPLPSAEHERAVDDVLRADRTAWIAWLEQGSREDWSRGVGILNTPATIVAGAEDGDLGPQAQRRLMAPHFRNHELVVLDGAGHLLPQERAGDVARLMVQCAARCVARAGLRTTLGAACWDLLHSDRVSQATRTAMLDRAQLPTPGGAARSFDPALLPTLAALLSRIVPQDGQHTVDLVAALIAEIVTQEGDGWRYAALPADLDACHAGLLTLDAAARAEGARDFASLPPDLQGAILNQAASGALDIGRPETLSARQMSLWFEDVRAGATRAYVGHPATLFRLGFSGFAYAGDGPRKRGFTAFGIGVREAWEPASPAGPIR